MHLRAQSGFPCMFMEQRKAWMGEQKVTVTTYESCGSLCPIWWSWSESVWLFAIPGTISPWNSPGQNTGVGSLSLLQGIFSTQGSDPGLPHCRWIFYQLIHEGSPVSNMLPFIFTPSVYTCHQMMTSISPPFWSGLVCDCLLWKIIYGGNDSNHLQDSPMWVLVFSSKLSFLFFSLLFFIFFFYLYWDTELEFRSV